MGFDKVGLGIVNVINPFTNGGKAGSLADYSITLLQNVDSLFVFIKQSTLGAFFEISGPAAAGTTVAGNWFIDGPGKPDCSVIILCVPPEQFPAVAIRAADRLVI